MSTGLGRRRQDHDRGRARARPLRRTSAIKVLVLTVDPARRLANALGMEQFGNVETRVPDAAFAEAGVEVQGELWAAMLDTKQSWDDLVRLHAPDAATRDAILANPLYQNITGQVRPEPRLRRDGAAVRDPQLGPLRPDRGGHPADPQRPRLPRRARAHGRLLLVAAAAVAHRPVPLPGGRPRLQALLLGRRPHPGHAVPRGHRRVLHPVPVDVRRVRGACARPSPTLLGSPQTTFLVVSTLEVAPAREAELLPGRCSSERGLPRRRPGPEQGPARATCWTARRTEAARTLANQATEVGDVSSMRSCRLDMPHAGPRAHRDRPQLPGLPGGGPS